MNEGIKTEPTLEQLQEFYRRSAAATTEAAIVGPPAMSAPAPMPFQYPPAPAPMAPMPMPMMAPAPMGGMPRATGFLVPIEMPTAAGKVTAMVMFGPEWAANSQAAGQVIQMLQNAGWPVKAWQPKQGGKGW